MLLPCMLDECLLQQARGDGGTTPQAMVVSYAAEFLKGMLDLMLEVHIHTEVCVLSTSITNLVMRCSNTCMLGEIMCPQ